MVLIVALRVSRHRERCAGVLEAAEAGHSFGMVIARSYVKGFSGVAHHGFTGVHLANMWFDGKPT